jgi:hypothetical protein
MSWLFSQALVEDCLRANYLDGERFAPLKLMPIAPMFLSQDKTKKSWNPSRFGTMFQPLTESLGVELLMWFLAGFRAKTYQPPEPSTDLQKELRGGAERTLATNGKNYWRSSTQFRLRGKQPNAC